MDTIPKNESGSISSPDFPKNIKYMTRGEVLAIASDAIGYLHTRTCGGRQFKESATDKARAAYLRVLIQAIAAYGALLRDEEITDLTARIEALEQRGGACQGNN